VSSFPSPSWAESGCWFSGIILQDPALPSVREICAALRNRGVEARPFWKPVHRQAPYAAAPRATLSVTDALWERIVTLPCSTRLQEPEQNRVIEAVRAVLERRG
jgi:dTDP-4-amino-4,6-dideoxygalactose transaminase